MSNQLSADLVKDFALAGNATITLQSGRTGTHYTYKIRKSKQKDDLYFVSLLYGQNNESDYQYIGCYYADTKYFNPGRLWKDRPLFAWPPALRAIRYFFNRIDKVPEHLHVFHEGRCGRCGRKLTTPESIKRGLGPECYKETNK